MTYKMAVPGNKFRRPTYNLHENDNSDGYSKSCQVPFNKQKMWSVLQCKEPACCNMTPCWSASKPLQWRPWLHWEFSCIINKARELVDWGPLLNTSALHCVCWRFLQILQQYQKEKREFMIFLCMTDCRDPRDWMSDTWLHLPLHSAAVNI